MRLNANNELEDNEKGIASRLWFKYYPYWPLFLLILLLTVAGAWTYLKFTTPLYESTASLLIKDEKKGFEDTKLIESLNQVSSKKIIENEMEVMRSRALMSEVVKSLHLYAPVFEKTKFKAVAAYANSPLSIEAKQPDSLVEVAKVHFHFEKDTNAIKIGDTLYALNEWVSTPYGELKFTRRNITDADDKSFYFSIKSPKKVTLDLLSELDVMAANKLSSIISLSLRDEVPKRSEDILNGLMLAYAKASVRDKNSLAANTLDFIEERLNLVSDELNGIEKKMQQYKSSRGAIDISSQGQLFLQNVSDNDKRLTDVTMQLSVLNQVENYVKSKDNADGIVPSTMGVTDPMLSDLLTKLYDAEIQKQKLKKTTAENNPLMVSISDQINKIKPSILENINNQKRNLESNVKNLQATNSRYSSVLNSIPQKERDLVEISREHSIKSGIYNFLLQRREETALSLSSTVADSRIIDKAESSLLPVSPNAKLVYILAVLLAIVISASLITLNEVLKRTVMYRHEIEAATSVPIIGEIIYQKSKEPLVIGEGKRTFIAEQFRKLRTSLPYIGLHGERKKLLVTSTVPGDGKSFIVANLGLSLALTGKKVVVLEFDLSDPTLSEKLEMSAEKGLSDYLNNEAEPEEIIRRTTVNNNLFIIPAGKLPENPSELILSPRAAELMKYLSPLFDYIIIDTAPVGLLSDAYVLSAYCDATLYVIRHRHTPKLSIQRLDENNKINELKNIAIVFNGIRSRGFLKNEYGYGYGYGYIHREKKKNKTIKQNTT